MSNFPRASSLAVWTAVAAVGVASVTACGGGESVGDDQENFRGTTDGISRVPKGERRAPHELKGKTLQGSQLDLASFMGKVVVINAWGSWCAPCRAEAPIFARTAKDTKGKGVEFVGINTRENNLKSALAFEEDAGIEYPSFYDPSGRLMMNGFPKGTLNLQALPSTVVLDRHGKIAARALGSLSEKDLHKMIDPLIAEK
ncbi:TlpA family protein disulfide reductase [Streptomyces sp. NPDC056002]|uniref:TlpA family protein disulfide reductase n=1 Tax=Streptomyces sp. NPDC056002 TaxID=3345675 RepID=UPI0035D9182D